MKRVLLGMAGLLALGASGWAVWAFGPEAVGGPQRVELDAGPLARLDTVEIARRIVTASVIGTVVETESERDVLVTDGTGAITVRLKPEHGLVEGATLLARGRIQEADGAPRRLHAVSWVHVDAALLPSSEGPDSVRVRPDSARFGNPVDRSPKGSDRSAE